MRKGDRAGGVFIQVLYARQVELKAQGEKRSPLGLPEEVETAIGYAEKLINLNEGLRRALKLDLAKHPIDQANDRAIGSGIVG